MREKADFTLEDGRLVLSGPLRVSSLGNLDKRLDEVTEAVSEVDLSRISDIDTSGAWLVWRVADDLGADITGADEKAQRLIAAVSEDEEEAEEEPEDERNRYEQIAGWVGRRVFNYGEGLFRIVGFLGAFLLSMGFLIRHPSQFRWTALVRQMELVGIKSLGIIGLMSFLIGIVIAQQGAVQLEQFGASIYTINLTGRLALRELGVLMTAIMVAGRSGSAFAAQIGTMRLTEEVDAMRTIGVSPMEALVVPRVLACTFMMILLGFYASVLAIIGGAFLSNFALDIPFFTFLSRIQEVVPLHDIWVGLTKAPVFGLIIAVAGCYQGMQVKGNAEEVGTRTTQAVVAAIFMVIVLDAFFAVFFTKIGWS